jgi:hypothetical protein
MRGSRFVVWIMRVLLVGLVALVALVTPARGEDARQAALLRFAALDPVEQAALLLRIDERIEAMDDPVVREDLALVARARRELPRVPATPPAFHATEEFAPNLDPRRFIDEDGHEASTKIAILAPWRNAPPFWSVSVRYDFGANAGRVALVPPLLVDRLADRLSGLVPGHDELAAWLAHALDHRKEFDALANYFAAAYCDLYGNCLASVTLYDAFASQQGIDMPDTDVIAFARKIQKSNAFRSPIPGDARRQKLYDAIKERFTEYFRHRSAVEAIAYLRLDPDLELREGHEGMRERVFTLFAATKSVDRAIAAWRQCKDRDAFVAKTDAWRKDDAIVAAAQEFRIARNEARWRIHDLTVDVLRDRGVWDEPAPPPGEDGAR